MESIASIKIIVPDVIDNLFATDVVPNKKLLGQLINGGGDLKTAFIAIAHRHKMKVGKVEFPGGTELVHKHYADMMDRMNEGKVLL